MEVGRIMKRHETVEFKLEVSRKIIRKIISLFIILVLAVSAACMMTSCGGSGDSGGSGSGGESGDVAELKKDLTGICDYLESAHDGYYKPGESGSDWSVILYSRADRDFDYKTYLDEMANQITLRYKTDEKLDQNKATEWHHAALAVLACGGDPTAIGEDKDGKKVNLIADGVYNWSQTPNLSDQGSNALIYGLITLDAGDFEVPEDAKYTRESIVDELLKYQASDGSFALGQGEEGSTDITAMAVQALAPYVDKNQRVQESVDLAIAYLIDKQEGSGLYISGEGYSSETLSQVIMALTALGRDPADEKDFSKSGNTPFDTLMMFKMDDGSFSHDIPDDPAMKGDNLMSSQQAGLAIASVVKLREK